MAFTILVVVALILVAAAFLIFFSLRSKKSENTLAKLGVKFLYQRPNPQGSSVEAYWQVKDKLAEQYCKDEPNNDIEDHEDDDEREEWMAKLPANEKNILKYRLMQRAVGCVAALRKVDADSRGYWRLFSKGMITTEFWDSVKEAETDLYEELKSIKCEASSVEPTQDPQGIIQEALQFVTRYGASAVTANDSQEGDAIEQMLRQMPPPPDASGQRPPMPGGPGFPPGMLPPGMPPGMIPPGMGMPPNIPPNMLPPGMRPGGPPPPPQRGPQPQGGGECDGFAWKQDTDELEVSVHVPEGATKSSLKVTIASKKLRVEHAGKVLVEGKFTGSIDPDGSTWTISKGSCVLSLEKADPKPWPSLFA